MYVVAFQCPLCNKVSVNTLPYYREGLNPIHIQAVCLHCDNCVAATRFKVYEYKVTPREESPQ